MDIRQLRYFVAIAELGSFSRAAAQLHVAQPALSLHVRNMEADLGTPLLFRNPKGVVPTEAGEILLRNARAILNQIAAAEEEIRGHDGDPAGEVRIGLPGTISQILAVPLILAARARYPRIKLRIAEAMSGFVLEWMRAGRIDLAVLYREVSDGGIATVRLMEEELVFFGPAAALPGIDLPPPGTALPYHAVARMPLILPGGAHGLRELLEREAAACGTALDPVIDVDSYSNIKALVAAGLGYSILPLDAVAGAVAAEELSSWPIADPPLRRAIHLARSTGRPMTNAVAALDALLPQVLRELAGTGAWAGTRML